MNRSIQEIKGISRENLLGKFSVPIAVLVLSYVIISVLTMPFSNMIRSGMADNAALFVLIGYFGMLIVLLLSVLFSSGLLQIHLNIARRKPVKFSDFLHPFRNHPDKFMGFGLLLILLSFACSLPGALPLAYGLALSGMAPGAYMLIAVGSIVLAAGTILLIIFSFGFSLTIFFLLDSPYDAKVIPSMKKSWNYMKGKKGKLFLLNLSFIGLLCLCLLTFGLGFLWVEQYLLQSQTVFYLNVLSDHMEYHNILQQEK